MTKRKDVVERFEVETEVRTVRSTVSVVLSLSWDWRGVVVSFAFQEVVDIPNSKRTGAAYASRPCRYIIL